MVDLLLSPKGKLNLLLLLGERNHVVCIVFVSVLSVPLGPIILQSIILLLLLLLVPLCVALVALVALVILVALLFISLSLEHSEWENVLMDDFGNQWQMLGFVELELAQSGFGVEQELGELLDVGMPVGLEFVDLELFAYGQAGVDPIFIIASHLTGLQLLLQFRIGLEFEGFIEIQLREFPLIVAGGEESHRQVEELREIHSEILQDVEAVLQHLPAKALAVDDLLLKKVYELVVSGVADGAVEPLMRHIEESLVFDEVL